MAEQKHELLNSLYCVPSVRAACYPIAENMRQPDIDEVKAFSGLSPMDAMLNGFDATIMPITIHSKEEGPCGMFGCCPSYRDGVSAATVWLLGTEAITKNSIRFLRESRYWLDTVTKDYDLVFNCIDKRNTVHIKWLQWLKFSLIREIPEFGVENRPFIEFVKVNYV